MAQRPRVSIVTPSFQQGRFLEETMASVLGQTYDDVEYIVVDGGSTDGSVDVIRSHASRLAYWCSEKDTGFADAIAKGFRRSTGSILAYLNSDDVLAPGAVEAAVAQLTARPDLVMVYGNRVCIDERGRLLYLRPSVPFGAGTPHSCTVLAQETCFFRRDAYERVGGVNVTMRFAVDYDLFSRLAQTGRIAHCPDIWGFFRKHPTSKTMTEYATLGRSEVAAVQREIWGGETPAAQAALVGLGCRAYATLRGGFMETAHWPAGVPRPPRAPLRDRIMKGLRDDHPLKRAVGWVGDRRMRRR